MNEEIYHKNTGEIICPYCGHEVEDSYEIEEDYGNYECCECEKEFIYERFREVTYSTHKIKD